MKTERKPIETIQPELTLPASAVVSQAAVPPPASVVFGCEEHVAHVIDLLAEGERLITIGGPPGVGKRTLAKEVGRRTVGALGLTVTFIPASAVQENHGSWDGFLNLVRGGKQSAGRRLVVSESIHPFADCDPTAWNDLLDEDESVSYLIPSPGGLKMYGEQRYTLMPLRTPGRISDDDNSLTALGEVSSVALFVNRAARHVSGFSLNEENSEQIASICRKLNGLPLAIELAAERLAYCSLDRIVSGMSCLMDILVPEDGSTLRSMREAIATEYKLLQPESQYAFRKLCLLNGEFALEGAVFLLGEEAARPALQDLANASFLSVREHDSRMNFSILEPLRQFGLEAGWSGTRKSQ